MADPLIEVPPTNPSMFQLTLLQLVGLLRDKNPVVRQLAVENLLPYTQSGNPHLDIWKRNNWEGCRMLKILVRDRNVRLWAFVDADCKDGTAGYCGIDKFIVAGGRGANIID
jgi:hypothetical protein